LANLLFQFPFEWDSLTTTLREKFSVSARILSAIR
jgi:hypothetical protein